MMPSRAVWICSSVSFSSMKPNALLMSSVISMEVRGLSLAKTRASICGMMFPISICCIYVRRPTGGGCRCDLPLECGSSADDLREFGGDGGLARAVVAEAQCLQQFVGVFAGLVHSSHTCA